MKLGRPAYALALTLAVADLGCGGESDSTNYKPTIDTYAAHVSKNYEDALARAMLLDTAVKALVAGPSAATLDAAKKAWIESRPVYELTEAFRFYEEQLGG